MKNSNSYPGLWLVALFVIAAALLRVIFSYIPALANFSPVAAMALFGGYYFRNKRLAFSVMILIMFLSDVALEIAFRLNLREFGGFHAVMPYVYIGFIAVVVIGGLLKNTKPLTLIGGSLLSSFIFFLVSNFGVWMTGNIYPLSFEGLTTCYIAAIPFLRYTIVGDLFFVGVMFGALHWVNSLYMKLASA